MSRLSYLLNKWFFWKNNGTFVISVFKIDIAKCFHFSKIVICSKDMTLWFQVDIMADDLIECPPLPIRQNYVWAVLDIPSALAKNNKENKVEVHLVPESPRMAKLILFTVKLKLPDACLNLILGWLAHCKYFDCN